MKALIRTVLAFERAIALHRPLPYHGDAFMLSSSVRIRGEDVAHFAQMFPGNVVRHEIGTTHRNAMSPHNPAFARALLHSVERIRAVARDLAHEAPSTSANGTANETARGTANETARETANETANETAHGASAPPQS